MIYVLFREEELDDEAGDSHEGDDRSGFLVAVIACLAGSSGKRRRGQSRRSRHHAGLEPRHAGRRQDRWRLSHHREQGDDGRPADRRDVGVIADKVEVHEMSMNNGVMKMRPVEGGLTIDPGKTVKLAPSGYHLMIMDLKSAAETGREGAGHARVRKGRQGFDHARCAGHRRHGPGGRGRQGRWT